MSFTSYTFLFVFLPLTLAGVYLTPAKWRYFSLLGSSWLFYGLFDWRALLVLLAVTMTAFVLGKPLEQARMAGKKPQKWWLVFGVGVLLGILGFFKYSGFISQNLNALVANQWLPVWQMVLPIGLSFYIFNAIAYLADVHKGVVAAEQHFLRFACGLACFAWVLNGPLLRYSSLAPQLLAPNMGAANFNQGAVRFMTGFCKKVMLADSFAPLVRECFASGTSSSDIWLGAFLYSLQLYFDFSGYSDMAIGLGLMLGLRLPENFNYPYVANSITEFWQRWHLSLSGFLKQYVYIPLGGNRHGMLRTHLHLLLTMLLGGLWHGANWTFVLWGAWNGGFLMLERFLQHRFQRPPPPLWYAIPKTLLVVMLGRLFFVAPDVQTALSYFASLTGERGWAFSQNVQLLLSPERLLLIGVACVCCVPAKSEGFKWLVLPAPRPLNLLLLPLFWLAVGLVSVYQAMPFLYYRF
jgi:alginate O-acetyltransferase complex protein AlgI